MVEGEDPGGRRAPQSRLGDMRIWGAVFALVFIALMVSVALQLSRGYYDARYVDVEQTTLVDTPAGSRLHLVLRHAPRHGQLAHEVREPVGDDLLFTVVVRLSAQGQPEPQAGEDDRRTLDVDLPRVARVRVLDLRWARDEALVIQTTASDGS